MEFTFSTYLYYMEILFVSVVGIAYFRWGKVESDFYFMIAGGLLMIYPYFTGGLASTTIVGAALLALPWVANKYYGD